MLEIMVRHKHNHEVQEEMGLQHVHLHLWANDSVFDRDGHQLMGAHVDPGIQLTEARAQLVSCSGL